MKILVATSLLLLACSSSSSGGGTPGGACPNLGGTWTITAHCVSQFVGQTVTLSQNACSLTLAAPFDGYTGTVAADGTLIVMGPTASGTQQCTGTTTSNAIDLSCPGPCAVTLTR